MDWKKEGRCVDQISVESWQKLKNVLLQRSGDPECDADGKTAITPDCHTLPSPRILGATAVLGVDATVVTAQFPVLEFKSSTQCQL
jgi:hypothetical protein